MKLTRIDIEKSWKPWLNLVKQAYEFDEIQEALFLDKIKLDPDFNPDLLIGGWDGNRPVAFGMGLIRSVREERIGYIQWFAVDEEHRRKGWASKMFAYFEDFFLKEKVNRIRWFDVPLNYFQPGIDPRYTAMYCFALKQGFSIFETTANLIAELSQPFDTAVKEKQLCVEGYTIERINDQNWHSLLRFVRSEFALWEHEVTRSFQLNPKAIHVATTKGEVVAFSAYEGNNTGKGWFGPMGTHPSTRGKGIGEVLLKRCLQDLKNKGFHQAIIPWVGPIPFYSNQVNARVDRVFWRMEKIISN